MIGYTPDMVVATWMGYDDSAKYSLAVSSTHGVGPLFQLEMYGLLSTYPKNTPFGVAPAVTTEKKDSSLNVDDLIQKVEETGKQLWSKVQEWTGQLWKKVGQ